MSTQRNCNANRHITQVKLDSRLTVNCGMASLAAYQDYEKVKCILPPEFKCVARFTGFDKFFDRTGEPERFGLILQSTLQPTTYLIAFRGTASLADAYEDIWANTVAFKPYNNQSTFPKDVHIADGFNSIYSSKGENMLLSMQEQLFEKLSNQTRSPQEIIITGHSLGLPLASLFTLDIAASLGKDISIKNITFASPRVGLQTWKDTYNKKYDLESVTYRIANYRDLIPSLPPEILGYHHIGQQFLVSFDVKNACIKHYDARLSLKNYLTVIDKAVKLDPQVYIGDFCDATAKHRTMQSTMPPSTDVPSWVDIIHKAEQTALAS